MPKTTAKWRLGLRLIAIVFLGMWSAMLLLRSLPKVVDELDARATAEFQEFLEAAERGEHDEAWAAHDRLDEALNKIEWVARFVLALNACVGVGLLAFIWATWLVTSRSDDRWERYARLAAVVAPFIVLASTVPEGHQTASLLASVCGFVICFGHDRAYRRIALQTQQLQIGRSIQVVVAWMMLGILILAGTALLLTSIGQGRLLRHLAPLTLVGGSLAIVCLSVLLWRLSAGIVEPREREVA
jgi:hypothetical protein